MHPVGRQSRMRAHNPPDLLLASPDPALCAAVESVLRALGAHLEIVVSAEAALACIAAHNPSGLEPRKSVPLGLAILDANLPGMPMGQLLAACACSTGERIPTVLISDNVTQEWIDRLSEGVIDDLILRADEAPYYRIRIDRVLRAHRAARDLELLRQTASKDAQMDRLTGVYNREALMTMLFRETDRVQRMGSPLCLLLFDIDDFGHWNSRLGAAACDKLLCQVAARAARLLRSYDLLGRTGEDEFLVVLPGCATNDAVMLAERLRLDVFSVPYSIAGDAIRLSACFGIAASHGRSPVVVLREAERSLDHARNAGPENIQCFGESMLPLPAPVAFLSPASGDELPAW